MRTDYCRTSPAQRQSPAVHARNEGTSSSLHNPNKKADQQMNEIFADTGRRGGRPAYRLTAALVALALNGISMAYAAEPLPKDDDPDTLKLIASETLVYDSNLFRLPAGATPSDGNSRSSLIRTDKVGFAWDKRYSLQRFHVDANLEHNDYSNHSYLNFTGKNGAAMWNWALTPHLTGVLSTERKQALVGFSDYRNSSTRNLRTNKSTVAAFDYEMGGSLHVIGAAIDYSSVSEDNSQPVEDSFKSHGGQVGVKYIFPTNSSISYLERRENGTYPFASAATVTDSDFTQRSHELQAQWVLSGKTTIGGRLTNIDREHPTYSQRNFSGTAGRLDMNWDITGKTSLQAVAARDLSVFQTTYSNYISTDSISLIPTWKMTAKTTLKGRLSHSRREFLGQPLGGVAQRTDTINSAQIEAVWQAMRTVTVSAALQRDVRSSTYSGFQFTDNMATLGVRLAF